MRHFWQGFQSKQASLNFKKHQIVLFWEPLAKIAEAEFRKVADRYPSVKIKVINVTKDPTSLIKHAIAQVPTVVLMRDGREVDRLTELETNRLLLEQMFRKAGV